MGNKFRHRMTLVVVLAVVLGWMPFGNEHAYAGTGGEIYTVAGGAYGDSGDGGPAVDAKLENPYAVTIDVNGNLYIADRGNNTIRKVEGSGAEAGNISKVAGVGGPSGYDYSGDGGSALSAQMRSPAGVAIHADGNLYIADMYNNVIRKVDTGGEITTIAGMGPFNSGFNGDGGFAVEAKLSNPSGIAIDGNDLYIADKGNHRIRKIDLISGIITTVAGKGYGTFNGDGLDALETELNYPSAIAIDSDHNLYIADTWNNRIRKLDAATRIITTVAGSSSTDGYGGDGNPAVEARLNQPEGIAVDGSGNLYIADTDNNRIRKVTTDGIIRTIVGTGNRGYSGEGLQGIYAELDGPTGVAVDSSNNLYIADTDNYAVRKQVPYFPSSDASLSGITLTSGTLSPAFAPGTTAYTATVVNGVSVIRVTPTTMDSLMSVKVNGVSVQSGSESGDINLDVGDNRIDVVVVAEDGTTENPYTIIVKREVSSNANLSQLTLSNGALSPSFISTTIMYTATASQSQITVTPTLSDPMAAVKVNGTTVTSGTASQSIPLSLVGVTPIEVVVTAQNLSTKTYTIDVTRTISANADLSGLTLSSGTLSPVFAAGTTGYTANVENGVSSITVTPTVADGSATVTVNEVPVDSGVASASLPLIVGSNTISLLVTAENGAMKPYTITVTRAQSSNASLSDLTLSSGTLLPSFLPGTYKTSVDHQVSSVTVTPTVSDAVYATVQVSLYDGSGVLVDGPMAVPNGTASPSLPLNVGNNNVITVVVTAQDGSTNTYTVTVTRGASSDAELSNLTLSSGPLTPAFGGTYIASIGHSVSSVTVTPTLSDALNASVTASVFTSGGTLVSGPHAVMSGMASEALPLSVGDNVIKVIVKAQNNATRTYTITVTRAASGSEANLSGLTLSDGTLSPAFGPSTIQYTANVGVGVSTVSVTMTVSDADKATTTVSIYNSIGALISGPFAMSSGTAAFSLPLNAGSNVISVVVTAQDSAIKTYGVDIIRAASSTPPGSGGNSGGGGGGGGFVSGPTIDLNGKKLDPAGIDTKKPFVTLELMPKDSVAYVSVPASILTDLAAKNAGFYLEFQTPYGIYQVPVNLASLIPEFNALLTKNRLKAGDVSFKITLTDKSEDQKLQTAIASARPNSKVMGSIVDFHIDIVHTNTGLTIGAADKFAEALTRLIPMPNNLVGLPELWGAFRYNETNKKLEFVPAKKLKRDGIWYAAIRSYTNSVYVALENAVSFVDVEKHWSKPSVELAAAKGIVEGIGGGRFDPDKIVTRAEFTAMLVRSLGRGHSATGATVYVDMKSTAWYSDVVAQAKEFGLLDFVGGTKFRPDQPLTREEMASMLAAVIDLEKLAVTTESVSLDNYKDMENVEAAYLEGIRLMVKLQIMMGTTEDTFSPQGQTTRAQAATVLIRTLEALEKVNFYFL